MARSFPPQDPDNGWKIHKSESEEIIFLAFIPYLFHHSMQCKKTFHGKTLDSLSSKTNVIIIINHLFDKTSLNILYIYINIYPII